MWRRWRRPTRSTPCPSPPSTRSSTTATSGTYCPEDARGADEVIAQVEALGIDVADLAGRLQREGADAFVKSLD